ncbi:MAG: hypothetical protein K0R94_1291 [Burkholderiales bacterium]|jgi:hypothetical protein|nr:hypothetical protein [Burkholderiales bacterium]
MKKTALFCGLISTLYLPFQVFADKLGENETKENYTSQKIIYTGVVCGSGLSGGGLWNRDYVGTGIGFSITGNKTEAVNNANNDAHNNKRTTRPIPKNAGCVPKSIEANPNQWFCGLEDFRSEYIGTAYPISNFIDKLFAVADTKEACQAKLTASQNSLICNQPNTGNYCISKEQFAYLISYISPADVKAKISSTLTKPVMKMYPSNSPKEFINGFIDNYKGSDVAYTCWYSNNPEGKYIKITDGSCIMMPGEPDFVIHPNLLKDKGWIRIQAQLLSFQDNGINKDNPLTAFSEPKFFGCNNPGDVNCTPEEIPNPPPANDPVTNSKLIIPKIKMISYRKNSLKYGIINGLDASGSKVKYSCVIMEDGKPVDTNCIITPEQQDTLNFSIPDISLEGKYIAIKAQRVHTKGINDGVNPDNPITKFSNAILLKFEDVNDCSYSDKLNSLDGTFCYSPPRAACTAPLASDLNILFRQSDWYIVTQFKSSRSATTSLKLTKYDYTPVSVTNEGSGYFSALDIVNKEDPTQYYDYFAYNVCEKGEISPPCAIRVYKNPNQKPDICHNIAR